MTSTRRQASRPVQVQGEWPAELAEPHAPAWQTVKATRRWLAEHDVTLPAWQVEKPSPEARRARVIGAWASKHHPSKQWPAFRDEQWMNTSGLRAVEQAARRGLYRQRDDE